MVSKVAVVALVAIIACPILIGYAMNMSQVTVTEYKPTDDGMIITPLLQNDVEYTQVYSDIYDLNTNFSDSPLYPSNRTKTLPIYESITGNSTSLPMGYLLQFAPQPVNQAANHQFPTKPPHIAKTIKTKLYLWPPFVKKP